MTPNNKFETPAQKVKQEHEEWQNDTTTKSKYRFIVYLLIIGFWYLMYLYLTKTSSLFIPNEFEKNNILFFYFYLLAKILLISTILFASLGIFFNLEKKICNIYLIKYVKRFLDIKNYLFILSITLSLVYLLLILIHIISN